MKREEAIALRTRQLQGERVDSIRLQQAIETIQETEVYYSDSEVNEMRRKLGLKRRVKDPDEPEHSPIDIANTRVVVQALSPWAIRKDHCAE